VTGAHAIAPGDVLSALRDLPDKEILSLSDELDAEVWRLNTQGRTRRSVEERRDRR